jgi:hypothetical protein
MNYEILYLTFIGIGLLFDGNIKDEHCFGGFKETHLS